MARNRTGLPFPRVPRFSGRTKVKVLLIVAGLVFLVVRDPVGTAHFTARVYGGIAIFVSTLSS